MGGQPEISDHELYKGISGCNVMGQIIPRISTSRKMLNNIQSFLILLKSPNSVSAKGPISLNMLFDNP